MAAVGATLVSTVVGSKVVAGNGSLSSRSRHARATPVRCQAGEKSEEEVRRRALVAGVGVGILSLVASGAAQALPPVPEGEPKPGTKEAIKKYANICRSMPTASVCHG